MPIIIVWNVKCFVIICKSASFEPSSMRPTINSQPNLKNESN